jgi:hypothetical protein
MFSSSAVEQVSEILDPSDFYRESHRLIFEAAIAVHTSTSGAVPDPVLIVAELERRGHLERVGGKQHIQELATLVIVSSNAAHHARLVVEAAERRRQDDVAMELSQSAHDGGLANNLGLVERLEKMIHAALNGRSRGDVSVAHSWMPIDLSAASGDTPKPEIAGLLTPGRAHLISGEPEAMKTWLALVITAEQLRQGEAVVWVDFEMGRDLLLSRVQALGVTDKELTSLYLLTPSEALQPSSAADVDRLIAEVKPSLAVVDAMTGALELHGWGSNDDVAIEALYRLVLDRFRVTGAALLILDHVTKNPETRGKWSTGSQRKVGRADVHLGLESVVTFGRGKTGKARIRVHKDRMGALPRPIAGELELRSDWQTGGITSQLRLTQPATHEDGSEITWRPTHNMEKVSRFLEAAGSPQSMAAIEGAKLGKAESIRQAVGYLVLDEYARKDVGKPGTPHLVTLVKPFREADLVPTSSLDEVTNLVPTSSQREPLDQAVSATSSHLVPTSSQTSAADLVPLPVSPYGERTSAGTRFEEASDGVPDDAFEGMEKLARACGLAGKSWEETRAEFDASLAKNGWTLTPEQEQLLREAWLEGQAAREERP